jgi:hypothetical protein
MKKRGLSTIVVTLILIVVSLVAVGVVWFVVSNILKSGGEQASSSFGQLFISLKLNSVYINPNGTVDVSVTRNSGAGGLTGINFLVSDGVNTKVIQKDTTIQELNTNIFSINPSELGNVGIVKEISIVPLVDSSVGNVADKLTLSNKNLLKKLGAVSWWKMNGNANDEIGLNNGVLNNGVSCDVVGKYGNSCQFDGVNDYIYLGYGVPSLNLTGNMTIAAWINFNSGVTGDAQDTILRLGSWQRQLNLLNSKKISMTFNLTTGNLGYFGSTSSLTENGWHQVVFTYNSSSVRIYLDGLLDSETPETRVPGSFAGDYTIGAEGSWGWFFHGQIDEVMIFNRSLTDQQAKALYTLDLTSS